LRCRSRRQVADRFHGSGIAGLEGFLSYCFDLLLQLHQCKICHVMHLQIVPLFIAEREL